MTVNGIDLYHGDVMPDLSTVDFVIHKATQGNSWADPLYAQRIGYARSLGKMVGSYHFMSATDDALSQVQWYLQHAQPQPGDILALDFERDVTWDGESDAAICGMATMVMDLLFRAKMGNRKLLYCSISTRNNLVVPYSIPEGDGLWIAAPDGEPPFPHVMRQYASSNVDYDMTYFTSVQAMREWIMMDPATTVSQRQQRMFLED